MTEIEIRTPRDLGDSFNTVREAYEGSTGIIVTIRTIGKKRTLSQNASLHLYCERLSEKMNDAGFTQRQLLVKFKEKFELPVTEHMIKDIFRSIGEAMFKKKSTTQLTTVEIQTVYQVVDQRFGEITGCRCEWPSKPEPPAPER